MDLTNQKIKRYVSIRVERRYFLRVIKLNNKNGFPRKTQVFRGLVRKTASEF